MEIFENYNEDRILLPFQEFLDKHYAHPDLSQWSKWIDKYTNPAFVIEQREYLVNLCRSQGGPWYPDFNLLESYYSAVEGKMGMDIELRKFVAYLAATGFLKKYDLSLDQWINVYNWYNPWLKEGEDKSIAKILLYRHGDSYLKTRLLEMPWWRMM